MNDRQLYAQILGLTEPWIVSDVALDLAAGMVNLTVEVGVKGPLPCPECGAASPRYDSRYREWRHLDTCQLRTMIGGEVPRVKCKEHGVRQVHVPWAEDGARFTALFESLVIDLLKAATISAVAEWTRLSWDQVDGIQARAVARGLARRERVAPRRIGVDEKSFQRNHEYVTVVTDQERGVVLFVGDDRKTTTLDSYFQQMTADELGAIETVSMDMWAPYIESTRRFIPDADNKIAFDKFHVASHLGEAVDVVRRKEHRELSAKGDARLKGTKYWWLTNPENMSIARWRGAFAALRDSNLRVARAWAMKETAMSLWHYTSRAWAKKAWESWLSWAAHSRIEPMKKVAETLRRHLYGVLNAVVTGASNASSESLNARIQKLKTMACGFRNRVRFRNAIYFHLGGLDLYPRPK